MKIIFNNLTMRTNQFSSIILIALFLLLSCSNNDNNGNNISKGVPTSFTYSSGNVVTYSYTNGNRLSKIAYGNLGESISFTYSGNDLVKCNYGYAPGYAGINSIEFSKVENSKVLAKMSTPDSKDFNVDTIFIGTTGYPNIISCNKGNSNYFLQYFFVLDSTQTKIAYYDVLRVYDTYSSLVEKCVYEYDNNPGTTSLVDFPKWVSVYINKVYLKDITDKQLFNSVNNVTKEVYYNNGSPIPTSTINNTYKYGDNRFPLSLIDGAMQETITIKY